MKLNKYDVRHPVTALRTYACVLLLLVLTIGLLVGGALLEIQPAVLGISIAVLDIVLAKILVSKFILRD